MHDAPGQFGGAHRKHVPLEHIQRYIVESGSLAGLQSDDCLVPVRLLSDDESVACTVSDVVLLVSLQEMIEYCSYGHFQQLVRAHRVPVSSNSRLEMLVKAIRSHTCTDICPTDCWLFRRPVVSARDKGCQTTTVSHLADNSRIAPGTDILQLPTAFPPPVLSTRDQACIVRDWVNDISVSALKELVCGVCARLVSTTDTVRYDLKSQVLDVLLQSAGRVLPPQLASNEKLILCDAGKDGETGLLVVCKECNTWLNGKKKIPRLSLANGLWLGEVPPELSDLHFVEKLTVARYRHNVCVVTVDTGARKMHANAVIFSQPVAKFQKKLPPSLDELGEVLAVMFLGPSHPTEKDFARTPLLVCKHHVLRALQWLKSNHCDYRDLEISLENLNSYSSSEPPVAWFHQVSDGEAPQEATSITGDNGGPGIEHGPCSLSIHGITADSISDLSHDQRVAIAIKHLKSGGKVLGYGHAEKPQSIFHNPQLFPGMFPWLFPYGRGGFENSTIVHSVQKKTHVRYLLDYYDRRFQTDEYFCFVAFNQEQITRSSDGGYVLVEKRKVPDVASKILDLDMNVLTTLINRGRMNGFIKPETEEERRCYQVLSLIDHVAGHVPASATQKR